jgi:hypothetical protein
MKTFSKVALACVLFFAMAGTAVGAEAKAPARVSHVAASSAVYVVAAASDDDIPGVGAPASPITGTLNADTDWSDVYRVWLNAGQTLSVTLNGVGGTDFDIFLYAPNATSVEVDDSVADSSGDVYPETFDYLAPTSGFYYLEAYAYTGAGAYTMSYTITPASTVKPVWRFYNKRNGSHFYTATLSECNSVRDNLSATYAYEGPAYTINTLNALNSSPLYRFYNKRNGSHFYTASLAEKNSVQANLSATYAYDGPAYNVCLTPSMTTVWRFYNKKNGSHFYTANPAEKANVQANLSATYSLDGPGFYIAP